MEASLKRVVCAAGSVVVRDDCPYASSQRPFHTTKHLRTRTKSGMRNEQLRKDLALMAPGISHDDIAAPSDAHVITGAENRVLEARSYVMNRLGTSPMYSKFTAEEVEAIDAAFYQSRFACPNETWTQVMNMWLVCSKSGEPELSTRLAYDKIQFYLDELKLCAAKNVNTVAKLSQTPIPPQILNYGLRPTVDHFDIAMGAAQRVGEPERVLELYLELAQQRDLVADPSTIIASNPMYASGLSEPSEEDLAKMRQLAILRSKLVPDARTTDHLMRAMAKLKRYTDADQLMEKIMLPSSGISPSSQTHAVYLETLFRRGRYIDVIEHVRKVFLGLSAKAPVLSGTESRLPWLEGGRKSSFLPSRRIWLLLMKSIICERGEEVYDYLTLHLQGVTPLSKEDYMSQLHYEIANHRGVAPFSLESSEFMLKLLEDEYGIKPSTEFFEAMIRDAPTVDSIMSMVNLLATRAAKAKQQADELAQKELEDRRTAWEQRLNKAANLKSSIIAAESTNEQATSHELAETNPSEGSSRLPPEDVIKNPILTVKEGHRLAVDLRPYELSPFTKYFGTLANEVKEMGLHESVFATILVKLASFLLETIVVQSVAPELDQPPVIESSLDDEDVTSLQQAEEEEEDLGFMEYNDEVAKGRLAHGAQRQRIVGMSISALRERIITALARTREVMLLNRIPLTAKSESSYFKAALLSAISNELPVPLRLRGSTSLIPTEPPSVAPSVRESEVVRQLGGLRSLRSRAMVLEYQINQRYKLLRAIVDELKLALESRTHNVAEKLQNNVDVGEEITFDKNSTKPLFSAVARYSMIDPSVISMYIAALSDLGTDAALLLGPYDDFDLTDPSDTLDTKDIENFRSLAREVGAYCVQHIKILLHRLLTAAEHDAFLEVHQLASMRDAVLRLPVTSEMLESVHALLLTGAEHKYSPQLLPKETPLMKILANLGQAQLLSQRKPNSDDDQGPDDILSDPASPFIPIPRTPHNSDALAVLPARDLNRIHNSLRTSANWAHASVFVRNANLVSEGDAPSISQRRPNITAFKPLIRVYAAFGEPLEISYLLAELHERRQILPDTCTYNMLIQAYINNGDHQTALQVLQVMDAASVADAAMRVKKNIKAEDVFRAIIEGTAEEWLSKQAEPGAKVQPDDATVSVLIRSLHAQGLLDQVEEMWRRYVYRPAESWTAMSAVEEQHRVVQSLIVENPLEADWNMPTLLSLPPLLDSTKLGLDTTAITCVAQTFIQLGYPIHALQLYLDMRQQMPSSPIPNFVLKKYLFGAGLDADNPPSDPLPGAKSNSTALMVTDLDDDLTEEEQQYIAQEIKHKLWPELDFLASIALGYAQLAAKFSTSVDHSKGSGRFEAMSQAVADQARALSEAVTRTFALLRHYAKTHPMAWSPQILALQSVAQDALPSRVESTASQRMNSIPLPTAARPLCVVPYSNDTVRLYQQMDELVYLAIALEESLFKSRYVMSDPRTRKITHRWLSIYPSMLEQTRALYQMHPSSRNIERLVNRLRQAFSDATRRPETPQQPTVPKPESLAAAPGALSSALKQAVFDSLNIQNNTADEKMKLTSAELKWIEKFKDFLSKQTSTNTGSNDVDTGAHEASQASEANEEHGTTESVTGPHEDNLAASSETNDPVANLLSLATNASSSSSPITRAAALSASAADAALTKLRYEHAGFDAQDDIDEDHNEAVSSASTLSAASNLLVPTLLKSDDSTESPAAGDANLILNHPSIRKPVPAKIDDYVKERRMKRTTHPSITELVAVDKPTDLTMGPTVVIPTTTGVNADSQNSKRMLGSKGLLSEPRPGGVMTSPFAPSKDNKAAKDSEKQPLSEKIYQNVAPPLATFSGKDAFDVALSKRAGQGVRYAKVQLEGVPGNIQTHSQAALQQEQSRPKVEPLLPHTQYLHPNEAEKRYRSVIASGGTHPEGAPIPGTLPTAATRISSLEQFDAIMNATKEDFDRRVEAGIPLPGTHGKVFTRPILEGLDTKPGGESDSRIESLLRDRSDIGVGSTISASGMPPETTKTKTRNYRGQFDMFRERSQAKKEQQEFLDRTIATMYDEFKSVSEIQSDLSKKSPRQLALEAKAKKEAERRRRDELAITHDHDDGDPELSDSDSDWDDDDDPSIEYFSKYDSERKSKKRKFSGAADHIAQVLGSRGRSTSTQPTSQDADADIIPTIPLRGGKGGKSLKWHGQQSGNGTSVPQFVSSGLGAQGLRKKK